MTWRKVKILALGGLSIGLLMLGVGAWIFIAPTSDGVRDAAMMRDTGTYIKVNTPTLGFVGQLARLSGLRDYFYSRYESERSALIESGYLTNISVLVTNPIDSGYKIYTMEKDGMLPKDVAIWKLAYGSNYLTITCRPKDADVLRNAVKK